MPAKVEHINHQIAIVSFPVDVRPVCRGGEPDVTIPAEIQQGELKGYESCGARICKLPKTIKLVLQVIMARPEIAEMIRERRAQKKS